MRRYAAGNSTGGFVRGDSIWLPAALLATLALLVTALQAFGGEPDLQWQRARVPRPATNRTFKPSSHSNGRYAVQQATYNDGSWQSAGPTLAPPEPNPPVYRVAQTTPFGDDPINNGPRSDFDDDFGRDLGQPFGGSGRGIGGDTDELPTPADELPLEPMPEQPVEPLPFGNDMDDNTDDFLQDRNPVDDPSQGFVDPFERQPPPVRDEQPLPRDPDPVTTFDAINQGSDTGSDAGTSDDAQQGLQRGETLEQAKLRSEKACDEELAKLKSKRLHDIDLSIRITGTPGEDFPFECKLDDGTLFSPRAWADVTYMWKASAQCHKPLYFEDVALERYGHSWGPGLQPIMSGVHFFSRIPVLPYCMGLTPPNECIYPLGHYRPGNCAPYMIDPIPFTWRAALFEAGAWTGAAAIVP